MYQSDIETLIHCTEKWRFRRAQHRYVAASSWLFLIYLLFRQFRLCINFGQCCGSGFIESGWSSISSGIQIQILFQIRIQSFYDQKLKKKYNWNILYFFISKICDFLSPRPIKKQYKLQEKPSAFWVIFATLDPDPDCESGSGSRDPIESESNPDTDMDPDPWRCF
jgi:hypothetical protein